MAEAQSLLSLIARGYAAGREDAATEALCFIVSRSDSARAALAEFLGFDGDPLPIASFSTQLLVHGAFPDMTCLDEDGNRVAFIESKFWANLTKRQPVDYWHQLPDNLPASLLFLAPAARIARTGRDSLWGELLEQLHRDGHELGPADWREPGSLVTAPSKDGQRRLMLASWDVLLDKLTQQTLRDADFKACFEIAELRGLARDAIKDDDPIRDANLKQLITDTVTRLEESDWANTDGLAVGGLEGVHWVRYFRLAGAPAGLRIDYRATKQMGNPLWLWFWNDRDSLRLVEMDDVRERLGALAEPGLKWLSRDVCVPIDLPAGADCEATLHSVITELKRIAKIIDPDGPTYRCDSTTG
jgi:hypothetical protein